MTPATLTPPSGVGGFPEMPPQVPQSPSRWRRAFGIIMMRLVGWRIVGNFPDMPKFVLIVAPHTSNWDFFYGALAYFALRLETVWLVKESALRGPWGALARHFGAAGIDRSRTGNMVQAYIDEFLKRDKMVLTITPEGTRKKVADWRRGFYHVAIGAGVPIVPVAFDFSRKRILIGQAFLPSSDVERDVPLLKSFFRREMARHPDQF